MKKQMICWLLIIALMACGCGARRKTQEQDASGKPEVVVLSTAPVGGEPDESARYGVYSLDGGEQSEEFGTYDSDTADESALLARDGAAFTIRNADINKTGDSAGDILFGMNAAAASVSGAQLILENCTLTTNGLGASGLFCGGEGSRLSVVSSQIVTAGGNSPALVLAAGGAADIGETRLMTEAADAPLLAVRGDAAARLSGCTLQFSAAHAVEARGGTLALTLDAQRLEGDIRLVDMDEMSAGLRLTLQNEAFFQGAILAANTSAVHVALDEGSSWTLTQEQTLAGLTAPDTNFSGIQSNGFNIYYNAGLETNVWLNSQAYRLPGGGYLSPLI